MDVQHFPKYSSFIPAFEEGVFSVASVRFLSLYTFTAGAYQGLSFGATSQTKAHKAPVTTNVV